MILVRNIFSVFSGAVVAQVIPIVGTVVLAWIYDATSFGVFSAWLGAALFLGVLLTCRLEASLAIEEDGLARAEAVFMIIVTIAISSIVATILIFLTILADLKLFASLTNILLLFLIPTAALIAANQTLLNWASGDGRYRHLGIMRVSQASSIIFIQIAMGFFWPNDFGLACGYFLGVGAGFVVSYICMPVQKIKRATLFARLPAYWIKQRRFFMFSLPADALNTATAQLPVIMVAARFGADAAGLLSMAIRMLGAPMSLISFSVLDVFKRYAGKAFRERGECRDEYIQTLRVLSVVAAAAGIGIAFGAKPVFELFFSSEWAGAATMAVWLVPRFVIGFVASPLSYMLYVASKQHLDLVWQIALLIMSVITLSLGGSLEQALISYGLGYGGLYLIYLWMSYKFSFGGEL